MRSMNARRLRSAQSISTREEAVKHAAASRRSSRLHLQQLLHRHVWRMRGWQRMQEVWTEWSLETALPLPTPAPPQPRPLPIIDPAAFPALPSAPAQAASAGLAQDIRKREVAANPPNPPKSQDRPPLPRAASFPMDGGEEAEDAGGLLLPWRYPAPLTSD